MQVKVSAEAKPDFKKVPALEWTMRELVAGDLAAWMKIWHPNGSSEQHLRRRAGLRLIWNSSGLRATMLFRLSHQLWRAGVPVLPGILSRLNITLHGFDVPPSVSIGPGLYMPHPVGTVIMARTIGRNLSLISGITIGMRNEPSFPIIGDNVFIGAGARVLGGIVVGDNVQIGANAVVLTDVPANSSAVGVPARIRPRDHAADA